MGKIKIAGIKSESIVDGPGIRLVVFTQGCPHNCKGCHNPETHPINRGKTIEIDDIIEEIKSNPLLDGISISGGEPFLQAQELAQLARRVKSLGLNIITYTGYSFEEILRNKGKKPGWDELLSLTDILIDGKFILSQRNLMLTFKGSENQRLIDVEKSLKKEKIVTISFNEEI